MKKLILALLLIPSLSNAGICEEIYNLSGAIIEARDMGVPYAQSVEIANGEGDISIEDRSMVISLVDWAYSVSLVGSDADKEIAKNEFKLEAYKTCNIYFGDGVKG